MKCKKEEKTDERKIELVCLFMKLEDSRGLQFQILGDFRRKQMLLYQFREGSRI